MYSDQGSFFCAAGMNCGQQASCFIGMRRLSGPVFPSRHVLSKCCALHTCQGSQSASGPARIWQAFRSSYVSGKPRCIRSGTYLAGVSLFIRVREARVHPSRHVAGRRFALHTCQGSQSASVPARTWQAFRSSYVSGKPQCFRPDTYLASVSLFFRGIGLIRVDSLRDSAILKSNI